MRCIVRNPFIAIISGREVPVEPGQEVNISDDKLLIDLINERKISPIEEASWLIYSEVLKDFIWVVRDDGAREKVLAEGVKEAIFTEAEIDLLREVSKETLKMVHEAKRVFPGSKVTSEEASPSELRRRKG